MVDRKELRVTVSPGIHLLLRECTTFTGYSSLAEFTRVAILEKIRRECTPELFKVEEVMELIQNEEPLEE